jgi:putative ubiquitin-RnfH superfamily antitoxin RatB of RatAB toxin-antitoxin module
MLFVRARLSCTGMSKRIRVEVAYALPERQEIISIEVEEGCDIRHAIEISGVLQRFPDIDLTRQSVGIFSKKRELSDILSAGDRIEIYRSLTIDPKEARRAKAKKKM